MPVRYTPHDESQTGGGGADGRVCDSRPARRAILIMSPRRLLLYDDTTSRQRLCMRACSARLKTQIFRLHDDDAPLPAIAEMVYVKCPPPHARAILRRRAAYAPRRLKADDGRRSSSSSPQELPEHCRASESMPRAAPDYMVETRSVRTR